MQRILNQIKLQTTMLNNSLFANPVIGHISSYDPDNYCCKVTIDAEDSVSGNKAKVSGWLPCGSIWVGNGWGLFCPPTVGDMVEVDFQEGDFDAGHVDWRFFNDENRPINAISGEFYIIHKTGASLKFTNDGKVSLNTSVELDLGDVGSTLHTLVIDSFVELFNTHKHSPSGLPPTIPMTDLHLTTIVKAN